MMSRRNKLYAVLKSAAYLASMLVCMQSMVAIAGVSEELLSEYAANANTPFSAAKGEELWTTSYISDKNPQQRSCASCHTEKLRTEGRHAKTNKIISPIAPSQNSERLTKRKTIEKWFRRNCKWTMNRECTAEEKGHFIKYIQSQ